MKIKKIADKAQIKWRFCKIWGFLGFDGLAFSKLEFKFAKAGFGAA
ncbi:MAG: hypothetical protein ACFNTA_06430 [Campylobacter sp.]